MDSAERFIFRIPVVDELCLFHTVEDDREVKVDTIPQVRVIVTYPVKECTEHISVRQIRARTAGCSTHGRSDLAGIVREN